MKYNKLQLTSGLAAGGVLARGTLYRYFRSSPPVLTFAQPRPTAKPPGVSCQRGTACRVIQANFWLGTT